MKLTPDITPTDLRLIEHLLGEQALAGLATSQHGQPYGSLIAFAATPGFDAVLFATPRHTRKFANLQREPRVALLVDNRENRASDFSGAAALTILGTAREVAAADRLTMQQLFLAKHPSLKDFIQDPDSALMIATIQTIVLVDQFQCVRTYQIGGD